MRCVSQLFRSLIMSTLTMLTHRYTRLIHQRVACKPAYQSPSCAYYSSSTPTSKLRRKLSDPITPLPPIAPRSDNPVRKSDQLPIFPIVAIFILGSIAFYALTKAREGQSSTRQAYVPPKDETLPVDKRRFREG